MSVDYPKMIYHLVEKPKIVQTDSECQKYLKEGWEEKPFSDNVETLEKRIAYHKNELARVTMLLASVTNTVVEQTESKIKEPIKDELKSEPMPTKKARKVTKKG